MLFRMTILSLMFTSFASFGAQEDLVQLASAVVNANAEVVVIEEAHDSTQLAANVLGLLKTLRSQNQTIDCVFLEFPSDLNGRFAEAVRRRDLAIFFNSIAERKKAVYLRAYEDLGADAEYLAQVSSYLDVHMKDNFGTIAVNQNLLDYLNAYQVALLPADAESTSVESLEVAKLDISRQTDGITDAYIAQRFQNNFLRNLKMADNVEDGFSSKKCDKAIMVVGSNHLKSRAYVESETKAASDFVPLQDLLGERGLTVKVIQL